MTSESTAQKFPRIAIFLPNLVEGGAERVMMNLAVEFSKRGYPVDFVLAQCEGAFMSQFPASVNLVELNRVHFKFGRSVFSIPALVRYLRRARPAALLSGLHANIIAIWAKRLARVPLRLVIVEHNTLSQNRRTQTPFFRTLLPWLIRHNYTHADQIVAVSQGVAEDLAATASIPREKISVVFNPIITPEMVEKTHQKLDHPWFAPGEPPVILSIGRLTEQKDFPLLIRAFAGVHAVRPARLIILGEGPDREALTALVNRLGMDKDVSLPGFVPNPYPYLVGAAVFVLSSQWEGLPTVLAEALYCGTRLVATDCKSGPREILAGGKYGKLVPVGDEKELAETIRSALDSPRIDPPAESWTLYEADHVVGQYLKVLLGESA